MKIREHGTRARYVFGESGQDRSNGCRCAECGEANRAYARHQAKRKRLESLGRTDGPWAAPMVDAAPVQAHVLALGDLGVGYRRVADMAGIGHTTLLKIRTGERTRCTRALADAVLAVPLVADLADHQLIDAASTWKLVRQILRRPGWTKARLSGELGQGGRALQLGRRRVTVRNADQVARVAADLGIAVTPAGERRLPIEPLLELDTISSLARRTNTHGRQWHRWKHDGIPASVADTAAVSLGLHPAELWSDWYAEEVVAS